MSLGDKIVVMDKGRAAQVGTPREIYFEPKEAFIADFIGTMNRISGTVANGEFTANGGRIRWDTDQTGSVELMFRPENATIADDRSEAFTGTVSSAFFLGDRTRIIIDGIGNEKVTIEAENRVKFKEGDEISIAIDPDALLSL